MFVSWEDFQTVTIGNPISTPNETGEEMVIPEGTITKEQYTRLAPMADSIINNWTIGRVGRAVKHGEDLPEVVVILYVAIIENLPALMDNAKTGKGGLVSSFSNGIDSYSFEVTSGISEQLYRSLGWMLEMLPLEWNSAVVSFEGGNKYAC